MKPFRAIWGRNTAAKFWVDGAVILYNLTGCVRFLLYFVATNTCFKLWRRFFVCIDRIAEALGYSRSSVEKALKTLRDLKLIAYDGQKHVGKRRPVAVYRLSGTPDCPLPEWVVEAREQDREEAAGRIPEWEPKEDVFAGQTQSVTYRTKTAGPSVYATPKSETPDPSPSPSDDGGSIYPPALPGKTGPETKPQPSGSARWVPHLGASSGRGATRRVARSVARRLLGSLVPPRVFRVSVGREEGSPGVCQPERSLPSESKIAVTYSPRTTEGASMTPFTDPAIGALPFATRYFYLGLRSLADNTSMIIADTRYLKAELFRYDDTTTPTDISSMIKTLSDNGKIHIIPGHLLLSDPTAETPSDGGLFNIPTAPAPLKQNPEQDFNTFWAYYPRRSGKGAARKAFLAAVAKGTPAHRIIEAAAKYAETGQMIGREIQFTPYPSVWLNQERWDDDQDQAPQVRSRADDAFRQNMMTVEHFRQQELGGNGQKEIGW